MQAKLSAVSSATPVLVVAASYRRIIPPDFLGRGLSLSSTRLCAANQTLKMRTEDMDISLAYGRSYHISPQLRFTHGIALLLQ
ncbi:hypothetical protein BJX63DRAFT_379635 [Aspergillus granulosus]|uniref:Uncharacterized protein n=1 Tax=Aspergillus granulosus TaxID=176169 RepID=A0ABR4I0C2_9EURO